VGGIDTLNPCTCFPSARTRTVFWREGFSCFGADCPFSSITGVEVAFGFSPYSQTNDPYNSASRWSCSFYSNVTPFAIAAKMCRPADFNLTINPERNLNDDKTHQTRQEQYAA
jgi:hypothetical protein